ncbi:ornithine carbamoyltransferase [Phenylobacterium sp.]|uniref:ornithine carbamoyltransferase n=1 Tax=Phenylobacterium sp. TaxID=1871053 RepID=UPI002715B337|nr:ornithine carbamoyltransferase [Phenylobacterium sp.]MDO8378898.1 ornithine carbamoyltransferase [Phenylobacterium sp.]
MTQVRHFLDLWRISPADLRAILDDAKARKAARRGWTQGRVDADAPGAARTLAMIFEKNSTRTRFSFDAAMRQLGGDVIISTAADMQLGRGETIEDTARVLSLMVDAVMIRSNSHADLETFASVSTVPLINGLSDKSHPCQIIADLLAFEERCGPVEGKTLAWVGDGNNVCSTFIHAAPIFGFKLNIASPAKYHPDRVDLARAADRQGRITVTENPAEAVAGADCVITDTWVSMGDTDRDDRIAALGPYQVTEALMAKANPGAVFMHDLPAHRGEEVTGEVLDGARSLAWDEAENRIHAQKSILAWCFGKIG